MWMLDAERRQSVRTLQLYLTPKEAGDLRDSLAELLEDPERPDHTHTLSEDGSRDLSYSIVTPAKLVAISRYTKLEQKVLREK